MLSRSSRWHSMERADSHNSEGKNCRGKRQTDPSTGTTKYWSTKQYGHTTNGIELVGTPTAGISFHLQSISIHSLSVPKAWNE